MSRSKVRAVVCLDEELVFLKRLRQSGKLINLVMKEVFRGLSTDGEKVVAAMEILDGRVTLKVEFAETEYGEGDPRFRVMEGPERSAPSERRVDKKSLLSELAEAARDIDG